MRALDTWLSPRLRGGDPDRVLRARLCVAAVPVATAPVVWSVATALAHGNRALAAASTAAGGLLACTLPVLRFTGSLPLAGHLFTSVLLAYTVGLAWLSGGEALAALYGSALVPFAAVLFAGPRAGLAWGAVGAVSLLGLEVAVRGGARFPLAIHPAHAAAIRFRGAVWVGAAALLGAVFYEMLQRRALERAEAARRYLAESERRYADLVENAPLGVLACDRAGSIQLANPRLLQMLGSPGPDATARINVLTHPPLQRAGISGLLRRCMDEAEALQAEVTYDSTWGVRLCARLHLGPVRAADGTVVGAQVLAEDVTERRRLEAERQRVAARVQEAQRLESLGLLAAGVAHDFNNLLTPILVHAGALRAEVGPSSPLAAPLKRIETAALRAGELTGKLLAYAGSGPVGEESLELAGLVEEMADLLRAVAPPGVELVTRLDPDLPPVVGQATELRQVVLNLVTNACDAIGEGPGRVGLRSRVADLGSLPVGAVGADAFRPGPWIAFEVEDTGCGMDPRTRARIFDPFFTTRREGRGLGLAAVLGIVRSHGGFLAIDSRPGRGSLFRVFLPLRETRAASRGGTRGVAPSAAPASARVLVVDDEPAVLEAAVRVLSAAGYQVCPARDGPTAVARFRDAGGAFDAVVLDLSMPGMDGGEVLAELRRIRPEVPVLLSSGYAPAERLRAALELGAGGFLRKPYSGGELARAVGALVPEEGRG